jgi:hypothetical protein
LFLRDVPRLFKKARGCQDLLPFRKAGGTSGRRAAGCPGSWHLHRNYEEWWRYIQSLLRPVDGLSEPELLEIDRLLMNFMTAAKSVID